MLYDKFICLVIGRYADRQRYMDKFKLSTIDKCPEEILRTE